MPNFFTDNPDLVAAFERLDLAEVVSLIEHGYTDPEGPRDYAEAVDAYRTALVLVGDISGNVIAPWSPDIDREGARLADGVVGYAKGTEEGYRRLGEAGMMGVLVPRRFGGLDFPATVYIMMIEVVSRADASMMTLFGYQDVAEAVARLAPEQVARELLLDYTAGRSIGAMVLTESGAGSDLQAVRLRAFRDDDGDWRLRGTKQFISNGNGDLLLVLARSEPEVEGMFGLSLFVCRGGDRVRVNRLEEKMGLHGSPTCELYFDDAPAFLVGKRRFGLVHVLHILNHARFSVAAQGLGIAETAYREALAYAHQREQFGRLIVTMPPVAQMLLDMRVAIEASRTLLYAGAQWLDRRNRLEEEIDRRRACGEPVADLKDRFARAAQVVDFLSPAVKYWVTEQANRVCYDAQQVHGGTGYMREMRVEQLVRDVRITSIYEGTSQVQVGLAFKGVAADVLAGLLDEMDGRERRPEAAEVVERLRMLRGVLEESVAALDASEPFREAAARGLVDAYLALYAGYLLADQAEADDRKLAVTNRFVIRALAAAHATRVEVLHRLFADVEGAPDVWG